MQPQPEVDRNAVEENRINQLFNMYRNRGGHTQFVATDGPMYISIKTVASDCVPGIISYWLLCHLRFLLLVQRINLSNLF
jgi:hypothetical protein